MASLERDKPRSLRMMALPERGKPRSLRKDGFGGTRSERSQWKDGFAGTHRARSQWKDGFAGTRGERSQWKDGFAGGVDFSPARTARASLRESHVYLDCERWIISSMGKAFASPSTVQVTGFSTT